MKTLLLKAIIYSLWFIFSLLLCIYLTFPEENLTELAKAQIEALVGQEYQVQIEQVRLAGLTGLTIRNLRLIPHQNPGHSAQQSGDLEAEQDDEQTSQAQPMGFTNQLDRATVSVNWGSLLRGDPQGSVQAELGGGVLFGSWRRAAQGQDHAYTLEVRADGVDLTAVGYLSQKLGGLVSGSLRAHLELYFNQAKVLSGGNMVYLAVDQLQRSAGMLPLPFEGVDGIYLNTPLSLGNVLISGAFTGSELNLVTLEASGGNLEIAQPSQGRIILRHPLGASNLNLRLQLLFDQQWLADNDLSSALRTIPPLNRACDGNACWLAFIGTFDRRQITPLQQRN